jgi:hypothetical protein
VHATIAFLDAGFDDAAFGVTRTVMVKSVVVTSANVARQFLQLRSPSCLPAAV